METPREYHYVYYSYEEYGRGYIGSRTCRCLPEEDINYFLKKMNWEKEQLEVYLNRAPRSHKEYPNNYLLFNFLLKIFKLIT